MKKVQIGNRWVGEMEPSYIVAEAGSNHNGSLAQAKRLIDVTADARADAVKFQAFRASHLYPSSAGRSEYLQQPESIYEIIEDLEMPWDWIPELANYCNQRGVQFLSSVFDEDSVDALCPFVPAFKIASYEMTHLPLLRYVATKGKPVILSTGTANLGEVDEAVATFLKTGNDQLILLQCTASYPAPLESLNIRVIQTMRERFRVPVGLSDHSRDPLVGPLAAVALGACIVEKHFTLSNELPGPDHRFAVEPAELRTMVHNIRELESALGSGRKEVHPVENELRAFARRSIFAVRNIEVGERFSRENIRVLRSGKLSAGLEPKIFDQILGRTAKRHIPAETAILGEDYA